MPAAIDWNQTDKVVEDYLRHIENEFITFKQPYSMNGSIFTTFLENGEEAADELITKRAEWHVSEQELTDLINTTNSKTIATEVVHVYHTLKMLDHKVPGLFDNLAHIRPMEIYNIIQTKYNTLDNFTEKLVHFNNDVQIMLTNYNIEQNKTKNSLQEEQELNSLQPFALAQEDFKYIGNPNQNKELFQRGIIILNTPDMRDNNLNIINNYNNTDLE